MGLITARVPEFPSRESVDCALRAGNDLDPSLVHRLEPLSLLLGILVWDGADGVAALALAVGGLHQEPVYGGANGDQLAARSRRGPPNVCRGAFACPRSVRA